MGRDGRAVATLGGGERSSASISTAATCLQLERMAQLQVPWMMTPLLLGRSEIISW